MPALEPRKCSGNQLSSCNVSNRSSMPPTWSMLAMAGSDSEFRRGSTSCTIPAYTSAVFLMFNEKTAVNSCRVNFFGCQMLSAAGQPLNNCVNKTMQQPPRSPPRPSAQSMPVTSTSSPTSTVCLIFFSSVRTTTQQLRLRRQCVALHSVYSHPHEICLCLHDLQCRRRKFGIAANKSRNNYMHL